MLNNNNEQYFYL